MEWNVRAYRKDNSLGGRIWGKKQNKKQIIPFASKAVNNSSLAFSDNPSFIVHNNPMERKFYDSTPLDLSFTLSTSGFESGGGARRGGG